MHLWDIQHDDGIIIDKNTPYRNFNKVILDSWNTYERIAP